VDNHSVSFVVTEEVFVQQYGETRNHKEKTLWPQRQNQA
jgi:hypothetical protein